MVDANVILELEKEGVEYRNAFKIASLMENEGISKQDAIARVTQEVNANEAKEASKKKKGQ